MGGGAGDYDEEIETIMLRQNRLQRINLEAEEE